MDGWWRKTALLLFLFCMVLVSSVVTAQSSVVDLLLYYHVQEGEQPISVYNPVTGEQFVLPITDAVENLCMSGDGSVAYIYDNDVWVLDVLHSPNTPINISRTPDETESKLDWTSDGRYLQYQVGSDPGPYILYSYDGDDTYAVDLGYNLQRYWNDQGWYVASHSEDNEVRWRAVDQYWNDFDWLVTATDGNLDDIRWYVWNGQERIDLVLPELSDEPAWLSFQWTLDKHLFITAGYEMRGHILNPVGSTNVFYWNGVEVHEVGRPSAADGFLLGNGHSDGKLLLQSGTLWYVWDGGSFTEDDIPDISMLAPINGPNTIIDEIAWLPDGRLLISVGSEQASISLLSMTLSCQGQCYTQLYVWDDPFLEQVTNDAYSQRFLFWIHDNGNFAVSRFDNMYLWGVTVYNSNMQPVFMSPDAHAHSRWSSDGNLAYCWFNDLYVWDGQEATPSLGSVVQAKWLMSSSYFMSCYTG